MAITIDGDNGISGVNGSATTPALQGTDSNTGIVFGTDEVQIATGGSTRATVDSTGNVGIGTSSPTSYGNSQATLVVEDDTNPAICWSDTGQTRDWWAVANGSNLSFNYADGGGSGSASNVTSVLSMTNSGDVGIDTTSPVKQLQVGAHGSSSEGTIALASTTSGTCSILMGDGDTGTDVYRGYVQYNHSDDAMLFATSASERMRIDSGGSLRIGKTGSALANAGHVFDANGTTNHTRSGGAVVSINRTSSDGTLIDFYQDTSVEGNITVSGSTVSYNGAHLSRWSQLAGGAERTEILRGSVLSNLNEMCEWAYEAQDAVLYTDEDKLPEGVSVGDVKTPAVAAGTEDNEQLNRMKVSDVEGDVNVAGVFQAWDDDDDTYTNDFYCAMTGDFVIRIAQGTTVSRGDLLMSAGDGTAKPQDDDIVRSKTIAKVTSTTVSTTYSDGSYCVPCVLMAC